MNGLSELSVPHERHPMGRSLDEKDFPMGPLYISYGTIHHNNRLMQHFLYRPSQGHAGHKRITMHGFTSPRDLCRALPLLLRQGKGPIKRYPSPKPKIETIEQTIQHQCKRLHRD
ncbi:hypothetical protein CRG98_021738 [Punica granatum]|uniref:Uncharacterized protein n=1 Tax=Punica granatum TaxID=22663 RepID=A0A2I0JNK7_PUNGR|nr:hypothetical protein CRG98_021738 [Punica granatum]